MVLVAQVHDRSREARIFELKFGVRNPCPRASDPAFPDSILLLNLITLMQKTGCTRDTFAPLFVIECCSYVRS